MVCRKRKLANLKDYALIVNELNMLAYLDRTVASLGGRRELTLVKRSTLPQLGIEPESRSARTTDPNGTSNHLMLRIAAQCFCFSSFYFQTDIGCPRDTAKCCGRLRDSIQGSLSFLIGVPHGVNFATKEIHHLPQNAYASSPGTHFGYRWCLYPCKILHHYQRSEMTVFLQIMPSTNKAKAVFDSGKTVSFHIKSIIQCQQSAKSSTLFKIIVQRDSGSKRYDFEADTPKLAGKLRHSLLLSYRTDGGDR